MSRIDLSNAEKLAVIRALAEALTKVYLTGENGQVGDMRQRAHRILDLIESLEVFPNGTLVE